MGWYAIDALQDALDETKGFLWPPERGVWLRLAVIVFFVGGPGGSFGNGLNNAGQGFRETTGAGPDAPPDAGLEQALGELGSRPDLVGLLLAAAAVLLVLILVFTYLGAVFEFVFYRVLTDEEVRLGGPFRRYLWDGLKYAAFRFALLLVMIGSIAAVVAAILASPGVGLLLVLPMILLWLLIAVVGFFVHALAIPTMVVEDAGFVDALRVTWRRVREEWKQAAVFLLTHVAVSIGAGVVLAIGVLVGVIALAIPLAILGLVLVAIAEILVAIPILLGLVGLLAIYFALAIPVQTYVYRWILGVHAEFAADASAN